MAKDINRFQVNYLKSEFTNEVIEESAWCAVPWNENSRTPLYLMIASTVVAFIIPFTLVTVLYYRLIIFLIFTSFPSHSLIRHDCNSSAHN